VTPNIRRRIVVLAVAFTAAGGALAETSTNRGMAALFANEHGGELHACPELVGLMFPGSNPAACLTIPAQTLALVRGLLDETVADIHGIDWSGPWDVDEGGDPRQMVHRRLRIGESEFVVTLRLAGPSADAREALVVIQRSGR
jgi:hypothetical protein